MELDQDLATEFIDQILELSADTQVRRRMAVKGSPEFQNLSGAIAAYGTILAIFTTLQRVREFYEKASAQHSSDCTSWVS